jgi:hypothetical protein
MKKILIGLILCLILTSQGNSQTLLNDSTCIVPCSALKKALIIKVDYDLKKAELGVARDSINILVNKSKTQDTIIQQYSGVVGLKDSVINLKNEIIINKDFQIKDLNKNVKTLKKQRNIAVVGGAFTVILTIVLAIVF